MLDVLVKDIKNNQVQSLTSKKKRIMDGILKKAFISCL